METVVQRLEDNRGVDPAKTKERTKLVVDIDENKDKLSIKQH